MPVVYAAVVPHAPLLIPAVAKEHEGLLAVTKQQLVAMAEELYASQPDAIVILSPHGPVVPKAVSVLIADEYHGQLTEFGDIQTKVVARGVPGSSHQLKTVAEQSEVPLVLQTTSTLDYGLTVPLHFLLSHLPACPIIPISVGGQSNTALLRFGQVLYEFFHSQIGRYALIASADLSRRTGPATTDLRPTATDRLVASAITSLDPGKLLQLEPAETFCGLNPLIVFISSLQPSRPKITIRSFEAPFGVGQITASAENV